MAALQLTRPVATGLPPLPPPELISETQWRVLMSFMDTVVPSVRRATDGKSTVSHGYLSITDADYETTKKGLEKVGTDTAPLNAYLDEKPSEIPLFGHVLKITLGGLPDETRNTLLMALSLLSTRAGSLLLTGSPTPFDQLSIQGRTQVINRWRSSWLAPLRTLGKSLPALAVNVWSRTSPTLGPLTGFPSVPKDWKPVPSFNFDFMQFPADPAPAEMDTDVIIVGSGCGAGVCASNLAAAGHRVTVVDKGYFFPSTAFPMDASAAYSHLFEGGGTLSTEDGSIVVIAGSCWGGGGTVNWSASLQLPGYVRKEWAEDRGLEFFQTQAFQDSLDRVCGVMGVEYGPQNHGNKVLVEGARKLGYHAKHIPQNTRGCEHEDGHCTFGCWRGEKQGPANCWLPDAAKHGAKFIEGMKVDRVLFEQVGKTRKAVGVVGTWVERPADGRWDAPVGDRVTRKVIIKAKRVIVSGGTLQSPLLLMRSGIKNKHVGRNLYLHPVNILGGIFEEDVRPWEGACMSAVVTSFEDLDGKGHGVKLEALSMMPSYALCYPNWLGGADYKRLALKYRYMNAYITLVRDRDTGYVYPDPKTGNPRIVYTPSAFDVKSGMTGIIAMSKMLYIQGAKEIHVGVPGIRTFYNEPTASGEPNDKGIKDPKFQAWLRELEAFTMKPPCPQWAAAHQMGTCRMGAKEKDGVVDPRGKVWGTAGLYVADASVFPSASGVNPMITNMAISDWISRGIAADLGGQRIESRL